MRKWGAFGASLVFWLGLVVAPAQAADPVVLPSQVVPPDQVVRQATDRLLDVIQEARGYYDKDPQRYFAQIAGILDPIVDFDAMARGVMGRWGTGTYYKSLSSDTERKALVDNANAFAGVFRNSLIETYGKGVLAFSGERIEVLPVSESDLASGRVYVVQKIIGENTQPLVIRYFLVQRAEGEPWRLLNVLIGDVNIGQLYRSQFANAMARYQGNMQQVIATWTVSGPASNG